MIKAGLGGKYKPLAPVFIGGPAGAVYRHHVPHL